ncbi:MAG: DEAD/DEAH box helicase [Lachnospiraceae bacterium]|jgi:DEAD/DEAH box helicase domain-containing protein|nr:DEAD/DEAH box helicase [Lachnospiraceae bacterium]
MIPSVLARQIQSGLKDYIDTTFPITNLVFRDSLKQMLSEPKKVFHEPYVAVRLPFRAADGQPWLFRSIRPVYTPHVHQQKAFHRLTGDHGRSTLVATGTGSGKTECFLYPILEYCYRHRGENGIKALILYPMNALAADQAKRMAELVDGSPELKSAKIRVGMYVGGTEKNAAKMMMPEKVITDHDTLLASPPDILMTNYKMLDYLLVRPKDAELWKWNQPETLKYIAVDELHTFDGAQGTDLACLLRRLKARLHILPGHLCCIGTSATMGGEETSGNIRKYAEDIFGEAFEENSIITEDRLSPEEYFAEADVDYFRIPDRKTVERLETLVLQDDLEEYLKVAAAAWLEDFGTEDILRDDARVRLGSALKRHSVFRELITRAKGNYRQSSAAAKELEERFPEFAELGAGGASALEALYALISHARTADSRGGIRPFLTVQVQVWMRELRRLMAKVDDKYIDFALASDLNETQAKHYLPVVNCRDCGETGWATAVNEVGSIALGDLPAFYNLYFDCDPRIRIIFPHLKGESAEVSMDEKQVLSPEDMELSLEEREGQLSGSGHRTFPVWTFQPEISGTGRGRNFVCPFCGSRGGLAIMGVRSATAISACVSELYASHFNDDKKLLAFTDNVQDASHHAGFFNSRTWRFGLRMAMQQYSKRQKEEKSLKDFTEECVRYWKGEMGNEKFLSYFVAPSLTWMRGYDNLIAKGAWIADKDGTAFMESVTKRAEYEMMLEFGMSARIGRSLEKSGCCVTCFALDGAAERILDRVVSEYGLLDGVSKEECERMLMGVLLTMKQNGAFSNPIYIPYVENGGSRFVYRTNKWLPGMREGRNAPKFITMGGRAKKAWFFDDISIRSWYGKWIGKYLPVMHSEDACVQVLSVMLEELTAAGAVDRLKGPENIPAWGISYQKTTVSRDTVQMACDVCGNRITVAGKNRHSTEGMCCLRTACSGHYVEALDEGLDFYGKLYHNGEMVRIVAREHTGLLDREPREELERDFQKKKDAQMPWDANLLSCTPTLEMGINIGDLSTVVMCSIPPAQAQYAQRAGRGGRTDGNSLVIAVANARPHDLYFYAEPEEMIRGSVEPPKVFLRATSVLSRQFMAYCMDSWVKTGKADVPLKLNQILSALDGRNKKRFPYNYLNYVQDNLSGLVRTFIQTFDAGADEEERLDENAKKEIADFAMGDGQGGETLQSRIFDEFRSIREHKKAIQTNIDELNALIRQLEAKPKDSSYDEEMKDLKGEAAALGRIVMNINEKNTFAFMSDQGLLPNYAFPEAGIVLKAILYRGENPEEGEKPKGEKYTYEYSRSASSAISEFAPLNSFYAGGKKLNIDQVDINTTKIERWRLCPSCSHAELESSGRPRIACDKCGSPGWGDAGQVRPMLKVQMVYSNMKYKESISSDDSDDRTTKFYHKEMLVEIEDDKDIDPAYSMGEGEIPFGYEFVKKATMREINFGEKDFSGEKLFVAGEEAVRKGFLVCKYCGKIQLPNRPPQHTRYCRMVKDARTDPMQEPYEECLFLYRQFTTEAIRILVPATSLDTSRVRVESFVAAFMLGMKKKFGNIDHLGATVSQEPVPDADYRNQYLVIYDTVPGGTGYLRQLMNDRHGMINVMQLAVEAMEKCTCREEKNKDGCYKCLYAYRQSQHIGEISKRAALAIFKRILSGKDKLHRIRKLSLINTNPLIGSELERQFLEAFNRLGSVNRMVSVNQKLVNEKEGYSLRIGECTWNIEPQVDLGPSEGVAVKCIPDFVLWPVRTTGTQKPVAVFTDGFTFHKDNVADDFLKRMAILQSGKYRVWSLSYNDVQDVFRSRGDYKTDTWLYDKLPGGSRMYMSYVKAINAQGLMPAKKSPFELLVEYLSRPDAEELFAVHGKAFAFSLLDYTLMDRQKVYDAQAREWQSAYRSMDSLRRVCPYGRAVYGMWEPRQTQGNLRIYSMLSMDDRDKKMDAPIRVLAVLNDSDSRTDYYNKDWNGFLSFCNNMQFVENALFMTRKGISNSVYTALFSENPAGTDTDSAPDYRADADMGGWGAVYDFLDDVEKACAAEMMKNKIPAPDVVGYELEGNRNGAVIGEASMAWTKEKVVLLLPGQEAYSEVFQHEGWKVLLAAEKLTRDKFGGEG